MFSIATIIKFTTIAIKSVIQLVILNITIILISTIIYYKKKAAKQNTQAYIKTV